MSHAPGWTSDGRPQAALNGLRSRPASRWTIGIALVCFFYIYAVSFRVLPENLFTARIIALWALAVFGVCFLVRRGRIRAPADIVIVVGLYAAYVAWVGWRTMVAGGDDLSLLSNSVLILVQVFPGAILLAHWLVRRRAELRDVVLLLQVVITVQGIFIIFSFVSWDFRVLTTELMHEGAGQVDAMHPFRVRGLTQSTGAKLSAFQAVGVLFTLYLLLRERRLAMVLYYTAAIGVLVGSIFLTGRTGFLVLPLAASFGTLYVLLTGRIPRGLLLAGVLAPLCLVGGFVGLQTLYSTLSPSAGLSDDTFERLVRWVTKEFVRYIGEGSFESSTVAGLLQRHWFMPDDAATLAFGDPSTWDVRRIHSDVGFVRMIFGTGLVGSTLLYAASASLWLVSLLRARTLGDRVLMAALCFWVVVLEFKEPFFVDLRFISLGALLLAFNVLNASSSPLSSMTAHRLPARGAPAAQA